MDNNNSEKNSEKIVACDVHDATVVIRVERLDGKLVMTSVMETKTETIREFFKSLSGKIHVVLEEGTQAAWLHDLIEPLVAEVIICDSRKNKLMRSGNKADRIDVEKLCSLYRAGELKAIYHGDRGTRGLKELVRSYDCLVNDGTQVMLRIKAIYRGRGIERKGRSIYRKDKREEWIGKLEEGAVRIRAKSLFKQLETLQELKRGALQAMCQEAQKHKAYKTIKGVSGMGAIRAAEVVAIISTPHRFRTKRQLWPYCGFGVVTHSSSDYEIKEGQVRRRKKVVQTRGLNQNYNRELKKVFKGAAETAIRREPSFKQYYEERVEKGIRPEMARLTVARKIAAITLAIWKKGEEFDPEKLKKTDLHGETQLA